MKYTRKNRFIVYQMYCQNNGKSYIGITNNLKKRLVDHWRSVRRGKQTILHRTIRKYGKENFVITKIDNAKTWDEACEKEKQYIKKFKTKAPNGMNLTNGGDGSFGFVFSKEMKQKMKGINAGERHGNSKMTKSDIIAIRKQYRKGESSQTQIAKEYKINLGTVRDIIIGKNWPHIQEGILTSLEIEEIACKSRHRIQSEASKLNKTDVINIRKKYKEECTSFYQLGKEYEVNQSTIKRIIIGKSWSHIKEGILNFLEIKKRISNIRKKAAANNKRVGSKCVHSKLTERDIIAIRELCKKGAISQRQLSQKYNVAPVTINHIIKRRTWAHI